MNRLTPEFYIGFMMLLATFIIGVVIGMVIEYKLPTI